MSLSSQPLSIQSTPDDVISASRGDAKRRTAENSDAVFKLPEDFENRNPRQQDTILDAVSKEETRTNKKEKVQEEEIRQNSIRQTLQQKNASMDKARLDTSSASAQQRRDDVRRTEATHKETDRNLEENEAVESEAIIAETNEREAFKSEKLTQTELANDIKAVDSKQFNVQASPTGTTRALHNVQMSPSVAELPSADQATQVSGVDTRANFSGKGSDLAQQDRNGSNANRNGQQSADQQSASQSDLKEREQLQASMKGAAETVQQNTSASVSGSESSQVFNLNSSTNSSASTGTSAAQVEIVTGIMRQMEQMRQAGKTSMQISMMTPEGQEVKLHLRASKDHVQISLEAADDEVYDSIYKGWADLTEQAAQKGIRLAAPSFIGRETAANSTDSILNESA